MGNFSITVKQDVVLDRVQKAQTAAIDKLSQQYKLDKGEILGDGVDIAEAPHLPFDQFMQLSGNDTKITKGDLLKFAGVETADDIIREYAQNIADSIPAKVMDSASAADGKDPNGLIKFEVIKHGPEIILKGDRAPLTNGTKVATDATASGVFSIINGKDLNADGQIAIGGELRGSAFVSTAGDAIKLAQGDMMVSPTEALQAILEKAGRVKGADIDIKYNAPQ